MMLAASLWVALAGFNAQPATRPLTPSELIAQARTELRGSARDVWPGWDQTPFGVLLVEGETERLLCHPIRPAGFSPPTRDAATGCEQQTRPRKFPPGLLAAMPAFGLPPVVVIGTPLATGKSEAQWRATLLHEHFHLHQWAMPRYAERVAALGLSGGDQTGMWMLNYPFPYSDQAAAIRFASTAATLGRLLRQPASDPRASLRTYLAHRDALAGAVPARDWRYLEFQLWQEGVARWTELTAAQRSRDPALREVGASQERAVLQELGAANLTRDGRIALYALGAGEAMLLERCRSRWQARYPAELGTGPLLRAALEDCAPRRQTPVRRRAATR